MFVIKKIGSFAFICETWYQFHCRYTWSFENDPSANITIYNNREDAEEVANNLNQDDEGNPKQVCEVVEIMIPEFRLV